MSNPVLLPNPRHLTSLEGTFSLPDTGLIVLSASETQQIWKTAVSLQTALREINLNWEIVAGLAAVPANTPYILLSIVPDSSQHPQGYDLTIALNAIYTVAPASVGLFYAVQTLRQLLQQQGRELPTLRCSDWPDFPNRGVMLDISRDKVPTMATLYELIDRFAIWKINQLQLYTEHTFAYRQHTEVWAEASPLTGEEILALDAYCRDRYIELIPNQNSFGHMRRWLVHPRYRRLAECPDGCDTIWGRFDEPFTLYPGDPGSLELVRSLYDELLPHFSSSQFNVGCDETVDLGRGKSKELAEKIGEGRIYFDFLLQIYREVTRRGYTMQFWGDILMLHPELVPELPRDVIALEWGYEAGHPFDEHGAIFAASGVPFYVCPGTSSWNTVAGRTDNALENLRNAAENGRKHGACGYLITDWGDNGHWQPLPVSYLGLAYGSAVSWAYKTNKNLDITAALDAYAFHDTAGVMGRLAYDLGNVYKLVDRETHNSSLLFLALQATSESICGYVSSQEEADGFIHRLQMILGQIDEIMKPLTEAQIGRSDALLLQHEFSWVANLLRHACHRTIWALGEQWHRESATLHQELTATALASAAETLITEYQAIWHGRNRPGGFRESVARLEEMRNSYR